MQFLSNVSQSSLTNPAFHNQTDKLVIGIPILSGARLTWNANFSPNYIFSENFNYSFDKFYQSLGEPGDATSFATLPLVYLSLTNNNRTFSFSVSDKIMATGNFDHEILKFIDQGLIPYYGKEEEYGPISIRMQIYRELAFSYAQKIDEKWSVGIRPKILFGKFYYDIENMYLNVQTLPDQHLMQIIPSGNYQITGPIDVQFDPILHKTIIKPDLTAGDYLFKLKNMGAGIDFGITYSPNEQTTVAMSVVDFGFTTLKYRAYDNTFDGSIDYTEENLYQSSNPDAPNYFEPKEALLALSDSLPYLTTAEAFTDRQYQFLPLKVIFIATQQLNDRMKLNFSDNLSFHNGETNNYLSAYFNILLGDRFELSSGLDLYNAEQVLPGFACSYTGKGAQVYLATNNIFKLVQPYKAKNLNLCLGVNFLFSTQPK
ncbi:DUF5723 family protein [Draconibacterium sp. IB214405]|uniref:DUF5723 family protein n=1 Tax=Draconibacterium sp. IB214405 TaxID=3097352 RepID=UPI002A1335CC|nr:DUF5723 family protein [Draconibacterium sp. IB214405]MDX8338081.1 DUF5723 family protein [Draconibacterium sp. IB214405]